jgi:tetratricopeptide (TPR) repeat protein
MKKYLLVAVLAALIQASSPQEARAQQSRDVKLCGDIASLDGAFAACSRLLAIRSYPHKFAAYQNRGYIRFLQGSYDDAISNFNEALRLNWNVASLKDRGNAWRAKKNYEQALADFEQALKVRSSPVEKAAVLSGKGGTLREKGDLDLALNAFDEAIRLAPRLPSPYVGRGLVLRAMGDNSKAVSSYRTALSLNPQLPGALTERGLAFEAMGDLEAAKADYQAAVRAATIQQVGGAGAFKIFDNMGKWAQDTAKARLDVLSHTMDQRPAPAKSTSVAKDEGREQKAALVIGNSAYTGVGRLANPANDARVVSKELQSMGFSVSEGRDLNQQEMETAVRQFLRDAAFARVAVFFYAGHGMQVDGRNYLLPIDATLGDDPSKSNVLALDNILSALQDPVRANIVVLDACRDNPFAARVADTQQASRSVTIRSGLAVPVTPRQGATSGAGTLIAFSTAPGEVAADGEESNSPFSKALSRHVGTPGAEVQQMLTRVRAEVVSATKSKQVPWTNSSLLGEVFLAGR